MAETGRTTSVSPSTASTVTLSPKPTGLTPSASRADQRVPRMNTLPVGSIAERASASPPTISSVPPRLGRKRVVRTTLRVMKKKVIAERTASVIRPPPIQSAEFESEPSARIPPTTSPTIPSNARIPPVGSNSSAASNPSPMRAMMTKASIP